MNKIYLFLLPLIILTGCTSKNSESPEPEDKGAESITLTNEELKILKLQSEQNMSLQTSEVIKQAASAMSFLQNEEITKGKKDAIRTIGRISAITTHKTETERTRSTDELSIDTLAYVVNFANRMGYAIVAADKRVDLPLLAFCPEGEFDIRTNNNPGMALFLEMAADGMVESIRRYEETKDSIMASLIGKGVLLKPTSKSYDDPDYDYEGEIYYHTISTIYTDKIVGKIAPLVPVSWSQNTPFNDKVDVWCADGRAPIGCVPVAIAQLMAYWKYPSTVRGNSYSWDEFLRYPSESDMLNAPESVRNRVASFMYDVASDLNTTFKCGGSSTKEGDEYSYIFKLFNSPGKARDYNSADVYQSLKNRQPVYAGGFSHREFILGIPVYSHGHAWLIDGYITAETKYSYIAERVSRTDGAIIERWQGTDTSNSYYHHLNWGWGESYNGFFNNGYFNANGSKLPSDVTKSASGTANDYKYDIKIIPFIYR